MWSARVGARISAAGLARVMAALLAAAAEPAAAQVILTASGTQPGDAFGQSVAIDGTVTVVGAPAPNGSAGGAAYVFIDLAIDAEKIEPPAAAASGAFGAAVAVDGNIVVIGAPNAGQGIVYVYELGDDPPKLLATLTQPGPGFGSAVAVDSGVLAVGAPHLNEDTGAVYVFGQDSGGTNAWGLVQTLSAADPTTSALFGANVALDGSTLLVGAPYEASVPAPGFVYAFTPSTGGMWAQVQQLSPPPADEALGYGFAVGLDGNTAVVGAYNAMPATAVQAGAAYVYETINSGASWELQFTLTACAVDQQQFGRTVAISGDNILVGAAGANDNAGIVYGFFFESPAWRLLPTVAVGSAAAPVGQVLTLSGTAALVGRPLANSATGDVLVADIGSTSPVAPPVVCKAFSDDSVPLNGTTTVQLTIINPNRSATLSEIAVTDPLQDGIAVANPANPSTTCGGTITATAGAASFALSGGTLPAGETCTVSVDVQAPDFPDTYGNVTDAVTSKEGSGLPSNSTTLSVGDEPGGPQPSPTSIPHRTDDDGCAIVPAAARASRARAVLLGVLPLIGLMIRRLRSGE